MISIIIIGAGMGGLTTGIYGQASGFDTTIFEAHSTPGGQCTSWQRKGYVFDASLHTLNGFNTGTKVNTFWREVGAMPCEKVSRNEFVSAVLPDGTYFHNYYDIKKLEKHMKQLSPEDSGIIDEYINGIQSFIVEQDWFGISNFGTFPETLSLLPFFLPKIKYFRYSMGSFGERFKDSFLRKVFPLIRHSVPEVPLFGYLAEHSSYISGDSGWPRGGGIQLPKNMAARYIELGGEIHYRSKVVRILTDNNRAYGVELEDGTRYKADFVVSNADGRKTIIEMLGGRYMGKKVARYCEPAPEDREVPFAVLVCLGVKRDLSSLPSALIMFLDQPEIIAGHNCDHLSMQLYGFDSSMAPAGKGVIKVELFGKPSCFSRLNQNKAAYKAEKEKISKQVIRLLENQFPGLKEDIEVVDVSTLQTWERFMGGTQGHNNFPNKYKDPTDIRNVLDFIFATNRMFDLPDLENFFFTGQWVTSMGSLFSNALTGKTVVEKICKQCGARFDKPFVQELQAG